MGLAASDVQIDRAAQLKEEWSRVVPMIRRLSEGAGWMEFYFHLLGRYRVVSEYAANMNMEARARYGVQLQAEGIRAMKIDMLEGAIDCILGAHLESGLSAASSLHEVHGLSQRLIHNAVALYDDEADVVAPG